MSIRVVVVNLLELGQKYNDWIDRELVWDLLLVRYISVRVKIGDGVYFGFGSFYFGIGSKFFK